MTEKEKRTLKDKISHAFQEGTLTARALGLRFKPHFSGRRAGERNIIEMPSSSTINEKDGTGYMHFKEYPTDLKDGEKAHLFAGYYIEKVEKNTEEKKEEKGSKLKFIVVPIVLAAGVLSLNSCSAEETVYEQKITPFEYTIYDTNNPSIYTWGAEGQQAQEGKFVSEKTGDKVYYDSDIIYGMEQESTQNSKKYDELEKRVQENLEKLEGKSLKANATIVNELVNDLDSMNSIYVDANKMVEEYTDNFVEYTNIFPDGNTNSETYVAQGIQQETKENLELTELNKQTINRLTNKQGMVHIEETEVQADGNIKINGDQVKTMVKKEKITGMKAAWKNFTNWITKTFNRDTNNIDKDR